MQIAQSPAVDFDKLQEAIPSLNPLFKGGASQVYPIVSEVIKYVYVIAGLLLLFSLISSGFQVMTAAEDEKKLAQAKARMTNAITGFLLLFVSYWLVQIIEYILGIQIF